MEEIESLVSAENKLLKRLQDYFFKTRAAVQNEPTSSGMSLKMLNSLHSLVCADIDQLQYEALMLQTAKVLQNDVYNGAPLNWRWNPCQSGKQDEPDLEASDQKHVILCAIVTTVQNPHGVFDRVMAKTLQDLSRMRGDQFYIVTTEEMERRAKAKIDNNGYRIEVLRV